jgi:hypothetical protein
MIFRARALLCAVSLCTISLSLILTVAYAKKKAQVPDFVLKAQTVCVIIDPDAGASLTNPFENKTAREDVEKALMKWGRFSLVQEPGRADLVIVIRRGSGKMAQETIGNLPSNDRPITAQQTDSSIRIGGQQGRVPGSPQQPLPQDTRPVQQTEIGNSVPDDMFTVYGPGAATDGDTVQLSGRAVGWRSRQKNILKSPDVIAVSDFRKAIEETEKQQKKP